jgi:hypothetical protein
MAALDPPTEASSAIFPAAYVAKGTADQRLVHRDDTAADDRRASSINGQRGFLRFR